MDKKEKEHLAPHEHKKRITRRTLKRNIADFDGGIVVQKTGLRETITLDVSEASTLYFNEGFATSKAVVSLTAPVTVMTFGTGAVFTDRRVDIADAHTVAMRVMTVIRAVFNAPDTDEAREEIKDRCTISSTVADRMDKLIVKGMMPLCVCPRCMNGRVFATRIPDRRFLLVCRQCMVPYKATPCHPEWIKKVVRALLFKHAVDNVVYVSYSTASTGIKVDEVRFADNNPLNNHNVTDINFTIFIKNT